MSHAIIPHMSRFGLSPAGDGSISSYVPPMAIAGGVVACLIWTGGKAPLPSIGLAAAFLFLAIHQDVSHLRIPNWLTLPGLALALGVAAIAGGSAGLTAALAGAGTALACTFLPFMVRWLGAGDVKACMVLGALWGGENFVSALFWMVLAGGALALVLLVAQGGLIDLFQRWFTSARLTLTSGRINYIAPAEGSAARSGVPFAVAMGLGACAIQLWGTSW